MKKSVIALTAVILFMTLLSACSRHTSDETGVIVNGEYRYQGELSNGKYNGYGVLTAPFTADNGKTERDTDTAQQPTH